MLVIFKNNRGKIPENNEEKTFLVYNHLTEKNKNTKELLGKSIKF